MGWKKPGQAPAPTKSKPRSKPPAPVSLAEGLEKLQEEVPEGSLLAFQIELERKCDLQHVDRAAGALKLFELDDLESCIDKFRERRGLGPHQPLMDVFPQPPPTGKQSEGEQVASVTQKSPRKPREPRTPRPLQMNPTAELIQEYLRSLEEGMLSNADGQCAKILAKAINRTPSAVNAALRIMLQLGMLESLVAKRKVGTTLVKLKAQAEQAAA